MQFCLAHDNDELPKLAAVTNPSRVTLPLQWHPDQGPEHLRLLRFSLDRIEILCRS